ncbi:MAG TPA: permease prefix domain 2-containing transporter [Vicinamibacterales bacterium]|nr:permease prefix domain 2-containing transporter [Vicinamibacterales bacterium]
MTNPPAVGDRLLRALLPPASAETMTGDLLEEYRDTRVPAVGRRRADFWYARQVAGVFLRTYGWFVVPVILVLVIHDLFNTFRDPSGASYLDAAPVLVRLPLGTPGIGVGALLAAALYGTWRTQRWAGGVVATAGIFLVTWLFMALWWPATFYPFAQVQQHNPYWIQAWQWSTNRSHTNEPFLRWIFWDNVGGMIFFGMAMAVVSSACGIVGSTMYWAYRLLRRQDAA